MRSTALTALHEKAIGVLECLTESERRIGTYTDSPGDWFRTHEYYKHKLEIARMAHRRLTIYYAKLVDRIKSTVVKSLQDA